MSLPMANIKLPKKLVPVFAKPRGALRYRGAFGGRGSGKSFNFALMAAIWGYREPLRILCTRELQVSIKESFHAEVKSAIASIDWLAASYDVGETYIRGKNGTEFIFKGLKEHTTSGVKSMSQIDLCICEEAETIAESSWRDLIPTVRVPKSELWIIWNPKNENSPTDKRFRKDADDEMMFVEMNYRDNPFFDLTTMPGERLRDQRNLTDAMYRHVWEGAYIPSVEGAIYQAQIEQIIKDGRFRNVPYDSLAKVHTCWDLGSPTNIRIIMTQKIGGELRVIDHIGGGCASLSDYVKEIETRPYRWGDDFIPHDGNHNNSHTGKSTYEMLQAMGRNPVVLERTKSVMDSISGTAETMARMYIDKEKCGTWFESIKNYRYKFDKASGKFLNAPLHDDNSHDADTMRYISEAEHLMNNEDWGSGKLKYPSLNYN